MYIALTCAAVLLFVVYLILSIFIYKKNVGNKFDLRNVFSYELFLSKKKEQFSINILLFISLALVFANNVILLANNYDNTRLILCILLFAALFFFGACSVIPLSKLKEHVICSILLFGTTSLSGALMLILDIKYFNLQFGNALIASIVVDSIIVLVGLVFMINPKLIKLDMETDCDGNLVRPKVVPLALSQWISVMLLIASQTSILIATLI